MLVVAREVQHCAADHYVRPAVVKRYLLHRLNPEVRLRKRRRKLLRHRANTFHRPRIRVRRENFITFAQEVDQVPTRPAPGVHDPHSGQDVSLQDLVKEINVDLAKLLLRRWRGHCTNLAAEGGSVKKRARFTRGPWPIYPVAHICLIFDVRPLPWA